MRFQIIDVSETDWLSHDGVSKLDGAPGRGSGRYPLGSGKRPFRHQVEGTSSAVKKETVKDAKENLNKKQNKTLRERLFGKKTVPANEKKVSEMTAEELREAKERNNLEKDYIESKSNLIKANTAYYELTHKPTLAERGQKAANKILSSVATNMATQIGNEFAAKGVNELFGYDIITTKDTKNKGPQNNQKQKPAEQGQQAKKEAQANKDSRKEEEVNGENVRSKKANSSKREKSQPQSERIYTDFVDSTEQYQETGREYIAGLLPEYRER